MSRTKKRLFYVSIRLTADLKKRLQQRAQAENRSLANLAERIIEAALNQTTDLKSK